MTGRIADIGACAFDAYGTLFDVGAAAARLSPELGGKAGELARLWRAKQLEYTWVLSLMGAYRDFWQVTGDSLDYALEALGLTDPGLRQSLLDLYRRLDAYADARPCLERLNKAGYPCAILSNGSPEMLAAAVASAGIGDLVDAVVSVDALRVYKTDPKVYQAAVDRLGVPAGRILFFSANGWDVAGAAGFGYRCAWVNRLGLPKDRLPHGPEREVASLADAPALLGL